MTTETPNTSQAKHILKLERVIDAPVTNVWRCWTDPELLKQWFCPKPWFVSEARIDLRPGGEFLTVMNGPDGEQFPNVGVILAVEPQRRIVTTDAFLPDWIPSDRAFMVGETIFEDAGDGKTLYRASAMHWNEEALKEHEQMGFREGWGAATDQLEALAKTL